MSDYITLGELKPGAASPGYTSVGLISENLGVPTLKVTMSIQEVLDYTRVANREQISQPGFEAEEIAQRSESQQHTKKLAKFVLKGAVYSLKKWLETNNQDVPQSLLGIHNELGAATLAAIQPIVGNIRELQPGGSDLKLKPGLDDQRPVVYFSLNASQMIWIVDGQHRRKAFKEVIDFLERSSSEDKYLKGGLYVPSDGNLSISTEERKLWSNLHVHLRSTAFVAAEIHLGLTAQEEKQLFYYLNAKTLVVGKNLQHEFDQSNMINSYVAKLEGSFIEKFSSKESTTWEMGFPSRTELNGITGLLVGGALNAGDTLSPGLIVSRLDEIGDRFFDAVKSVKGFGQPDSKNKTLIAQQVVMKGIARLLFDCLYAKGQSNTGPEHADMIIEVIKSGKLTFNHSDDFWQALFMDPEERKQKFPGIENYVHVKQGSGFLAGAMVNGQVRFGSNTNDIYRRIGDLLRYKLGLPPRPEVTRGIQKELEDQKLEDQKLDETLDELLGVEEPTMATT